MAYELLLKRIDERRRYYKLSELAMFKRAGVGVKTLYNMRVLGHAPKPEVIAKLARALHVPAPYFLSIAVQEEDAIAAALEEVFVVGAVQAGEWRDAVEWEGDDWYRVVTPHSRKFPGIPRFGLEVRGNSMNRHFKDGSVVICVKFGDIGRGPVNEEKVICLRRNSAGEFEATVKEYEFDGEGRHVLWPRSTDPDFQQAIILGPGELPLSRGDEEMPAIAHAGGFHDSAGQPDIVLAALVVQSVKDE